MPVPPPPSPWALPDPRDAETEADLIAVGADLAPGTVLAAYRQGLFPMGVGRRRVGWWSPDPRGILPLDGLRLAKSLRRSVRRYEVRVDSAFEAVVDGCARPGEPESWITPEFKATYTALHHLGWAHSVEAFDRQTGALVGGLYGVAVAGLFAGESMFHRAPDASKVALVHLVEVLRNSPGAERRLLDVQWSTPHLTTLGVIDISRGSYLDLLEDALLLPEVDFDGAAHGRLGDRG